MSLNLRFLLSYQVGDTGYSYNQLADCSTFPDSCAAEFAINSISSVDIIESVNVTVSGPYGSASSLNPDNLG